ncbi:hypothetical protein [Haloarchaeobius sp. HME9146]|uniref:hypothetical protein n=1 Tax=Haloarchaeobius sp. HME9146 TaxID=2978732 RepID=UPI0021BEEDC0|nr:hypothetical protein [Haloarchaeobius sp. HME9146]MCT9098470.1 hypothetical protein [Haloarchaeobius sp. HME9146]
MRRRHLLTLLGAATSGGCLSLGKSSDPTVLGKIDIINHAYEPYTVHVFVERDDQLIYWSTHEATAGDSESAGGAELPCVWGNEPGRYTVRARLEDRTTWQSMNVADAEVSPISISLQIGDYYTERGETPDFEIWHTMNPVEPCETGTTEAR